MLSPEETRAIREELRHAETPRSACIEALKIVQKHQGWVSDESLEALSGLLGMSVADLDGVATFYNLIFRKPVGKHVILLCDSVSCWIMGYGTVLEHLERRLRISFGQTTADGRFTLLTVPCLGACDRAPVMMIDGELHGPLTPEGIDKVLAALGRDD